MKSWNVTQDVILLEISHEKQNISVFYVLHTRELENTNTNIENDFYTSEFEFTIYVRGAIGLEVKGFSQNPTPFIQANTRD